MKRTLATALTALGLTTATAASALTLGVSMQSFDNNFQTLLRNNIQKHATEKGATVQIEDAQGDVAKQLNQINNFVASGVDAMIVTLADTSAAPALTAAADQAGIPLVFLNLQPENLETLPATEAYVGSDESQSGKLGAEEACRLLKAAGKTEGGAYILIGDLAHSAAIARTEAVEKGLADNCPGIKVIDKQAAAWDRTRALDMMTNWVTSGRTFDAIFANNDEMAIGAIQALKSTGTDLSKVVVVGVDATPDGLASMQAGDLDATVFQNAAGRQMARSTRPSRWPASRRCKAPSGCRSSW